MFFESYQHMKKLKKFYFFDNQISSIVNIAFGNFVSLEILTLCEQVQKMFFWQQIQDHLIVFTDGNAIKTISKDNFRSMTSLKGLFLASNKIETIPVDAFEDLKSLERLHLSNFTFKSSTHNI